MSDLYLHYCEQLKSATPGEADKIIASAFNDFMKDRLSYQEYGKIYFAAVAVCNGTKAK